VLAFATLPVAMRTEGTALFSLFRNIGMAIGVSVTSALITHNQQILHQEIGGWVNPFNRALQTSAAVRHFLDPINKQGAALLDQMVNQQSLIIAYLNDYKLMIFTTLPAILCLLLLQRPKRVETAPEDSAVFD
jgi:MFS transporter, DHA2 family, multidrug resistance protein